MRRRKTTRGNPELRPGEKQRQKDHQRNERATEERRDGHQGLSLGRTMSSINGESKPQR
jgi:hypothetical protein